MNIQVYVFEQALQLSKRKTSPDQWSSVSWASSQKARGFQLDSSQGPCLGYDLVSGQGVCDRQPINVSFPPFLPAYPTSKNK